MASSPLQTLSTLRTEYASFECRTGLTLSTTGTIRRVLLFVCCASAKIQKYKHVKSQAPFSHSIWSFQDTGMQSSSEQSMEMHNALSKSVPGPDYRCAGKVLKLKPNSLQLAIKSSKTNSAIQGTSSSSKHLNECWSSFLDKRLCEELYPEINQLHVYFYYSLCFKLPFFFYTHDDNL